MNWDLFLMISHIIGVALGVGGATFTEIFSLKARRDGIIEPMEVDYIRTAVTVLRIGLFILILSGFGFLLLYRFENNGAGIMDPKLWAKLSIVGVLIINAFLLQLRKVPFWLGAAISLTSWYAALILGAWRTLSTPFLNIIIVYIIAIFVVALVLHIIEKILDIK